MALNPNLVGQQYLAAARYEVGREKIREFASAVKASHPFHFDVEAARAAGYADIIAPPTFAIIPAQRADAVLIADPESGIDFSRVVHAEQSFVHHRPIVAGDSLVVDLFVDSVREMGSGAMITTRTEIRDSSESPVATTKSAILVRAEEA